jgi:putative addiction module component (TIGR02574 family)
MLAGFEHFRQLPIADKLRLVEEMWDDIAASSEPIPVPEWIRTEAERRVAESKRNPSALLTSEEFWRRVDENRG